MDDEGEKIVFAPRWQGEVNEKLKNIDSKVSVLNGQVRDTLHEMKEDRTRVNEDFEKRIRMLERWQWQSIGAMGVISAAIYGALKAIFH